MAVGDPYASLVELKSRLRITDTEDDAEMTSALLTATSDIEEYCRRQFHDSGSVSARIFDTNGRDTLLIDDFSALDTLVVKTGSRSSGFSNTLTIDTNFYVGPEGGRINERDFSIYWRLINNNCWNTAQVEVTARWGWAEVPQAVKEATLIWASRIFRRRDSPEGVINSFEGAPVRVGWMVDPDIQQSVKAFRKHATGAFV